MGHRHDSCGPIPVGQGYCQRRENHRKLQLVSGISGDVQEPSQALSLSGQSYKGWLGFGKYKVSLWLLPPAYSPCT